MYLLVMYLDTSGMVSVVSLLFRAADGRRMCELQLSLALAISMQWKHLSRSNP